MPLLIISLLLISFTSLSGEGNSVKKEILTQRNVKMGDKILTKDSPLKFKLLPEAYVLLKKLSKVSLRESYVKEGKSYPEMLLEKGGVRVTILKDSSPEIKVLTEDVSFSSNNGDFEIQKKEDGSVNLNVLKGEVTASSPHIHSFVPEVVKEGEELRYNHKKKSFERNPKNP